MRDMAAASIGVLVLVSQTLRFTRGDCGRSALNDQNRKARI
jgi:hypothetical protein